MYRLKEDVQEAIITKLAGAADAIAKQLFTHTTSADNLRRILSSGSLMPLKALAESAGNTAVNVERGVSPLLGRETLSAMDAAALMAPTKEIDKVFLTRGGYNSGYGDHIIAKNMPSPEKRVALNMMPEEYTTRNSLPVNDAEIYVPDEAVPQWQGDFPGINFRPKSEFSGTNYSYLNGLGALPGKLLQGIDRNVTRPLSLMADRFMRNSGLSRQLELLKMKLSPPAPVSVEQILNAPPEELSKLLRHEAVPVGSSALGTALDASDTDILLPFASEEGLSQAIADLPRRFPGLRPSSLNDGRTFKVFKGKHGGKNLDLILAKGEGAAAYRDAVNSAKGSLTDERRYEILKEKERLKNAWFFPKTRYNNYKEQTGKELGIWNIMQKYDTPAV
jgi:hypothetical protein